MASVLQFRPVNKLERVVNTENKSSALKAKEVSISIGGKPISASLIDTSASPEPIEDFTERTLSFSCSGNANIKKIESNAEYTALLQSKGGDKVRFKNMKPAKTDEFDFSFSYSKAERLRFLKTKGKQPRFIPVWVSVWSKL